MRRHWASGKSLWLSKFPSPFRTSHPTARVPQLWREQPRLHDYFSVTSCVGIEHRSLFLPLASPPSAQHRARAGIPISPQSLRGVLSVSSILWHIRLRGRNYDCRFLHQESQSKAAWSSQRPCAATAVECVIATTEQQTLSASSSRLFRGSATLSGVEVRYVFHWNIMFRLRQPAVQVIT